MTDYKVAITVKDGGILKQLEGLQKNGVSVKGGGGGNIFSKLEGLGIGQLAKLAGISLGIGGLVAAATKSSGMLQGMFKLWETGFMLIFKPIGDFIALALRPITMAFLQQMIIPFYKNVMPLFRDYGKKIGEFFNDPALALAALATTIGGAVAIELASRVPTPEGGGGGCPDCGTKPSTGPGGCINICNTPIPSIPTPGILPLPIPIPLMNPFQEAPSQTPGLFSSWNKKENELKQPQHSAVNLTEQLNIAGAGASTSVLGAKQEWGAVETASASVAVSAAAAALLWDDAVKALSGAVARISSLSASIPNSFTIGMQHFGSQSIMAINGPAKIAGIADTLE